MGMKKVDLWVDLLVLNLESLRGVKMVAKMAVHLVVLKVLMMAGK
jgi:hypothetical protein